VADDGGAGAEDEADSNGTTVTCPTYRYSPAVVADGFASLSILYPNRIFLGVGSGTLNARAATGMWEPWAVHRNA
jgi:F420-dependent hydroxymycolic acid dehydrogenase